MALKESNASGNNSTLSTAAVTVTVTGVNDAPVVTGTVVGQTTTDVVATHSFSTVTITDVDHNALESATITLLNSNGNATDANGLLSGTGLTYTGVGTYTLSAVAPGTLTAKLDALTFTPTLGLAATTNLKPAVSDSFTTVNAGSTSVIASVSNHSPTITGTQVGQTTTDTISFMHPFRTVVVTDNDLGAMNSAVITLVDANGNATDANGSLGSSTFSGEGPAPAPAGLPKSASAPIC